MKQIQEKLKLREEISSKIGSLVRRLHKESSKSPYEIEIDGIKIYLQHDGVITFTKDYFTTTYHNKPVFSKDGSIEFAKWILDLYGIGHE